MKRKLIRIMYVVTPVMLVLLLALNVFTIFKVKALEESAGGDETEDVAQENDVTVGGEYVIKATTQISDAYKSAMPRTFPIRTRRRSVWQRACLTR